MRHSNSNFFLNKISPSNSRKVRTGPKRTKGRPFSLRSQIVLIYRMKNIKSCVLIFLRHFSLQYNYTLCKAALFPAERYTSSGNSANPRARRTNSDRPKADPRTHGPEAADISHSGRPANNSLSLYDASAATGPCIQKLTTNQSELVKRTRKLAERPPRIV